MNESGAALISTVRSWYEVSSLQAHHHSFRCQSIHLGGRYNSFMLHTIRLRQIIGYGLGFSLVAHLVGCVAATTRVPEVTVLPEADGAATAVVAYLNSRGVPTIKSPSGATGIAAS